MRAEDSERWSIAVCGLNCAKCDIYLAGHGDEKLRDEIIEWFKKERSETIKPEQIRCEGCRGPLDAHWSSECKMMLCARKRGLQYCFQCEDFACINVNEFSSDGIAHHKETVEKLEEDEGNRNRSMDCGAEKKRAVRVLPVETLHENPCVHGYIQW